MAILKKLLLTLKVLVKWCYVFSLFSLLISRQFVFVKYP